MLPWLSKAREEARWSDRCLLESVEQSFTPDGSDRLGILPSSFSTKPSETQNEDDEHPTLTMVNKVH